MLALSRWIIQWKKSENLFMKCLFTRVHHFLNTVVFIYFCITEFELVYQPTTSLARAGIFFQNKLHISKLLIIIFINMLNMPNWKCNNISLHKKFSIKDFFRKLRILSRLQKKSLMQNLSTICIVISFTYNSYIFY